MHKNHDHQADLNQANLLRQECGRWLRDLREKAGLSQRELAAAMGLEYYSFISQIESGKGKIPPSHFEAWASAVKVAPRAFARELLRFYEPLYYGLIFGANEAGASGSESDVSGPSQIADLSERIVRIEALVKRIGVSDER